MSGELYIVASPIGNLEDITIRALNIIRLSDFILAESSARTSKLLQKYNIKKKIVTYNKDNEHKKKDYVIKQLENGNIISLLTDAGTPSISDPGYELIKTISGKYKIVPIPGASALTCSLSVSSIPINNFIFFGFLPKKQSERQKKLKEAVKMNLPIVVFENKTRLLSLIENIVEIFGGDTEVMIMRELTKIYETISSSTANQLLSNLKTSQISGEITLIIDKTAKSSEKADVYEARIIKLLKRYSVREVVDILRLFSDIDKKELYKYVLMIRQKT